MFPRTFTLNKIIAISITLSLILISYLQQNINHNINHNITEQDKKSLPLNSKLDEAYGKLPLGFEANFGQAEPEVKFISHGFDYNLLLTNKSISLVSNHKNSSSLSLEFVGASNKVNVSGKNELLSKTNYLIGQDSTKWKKEIPNYSQVSYQEIYPGIDLLFYGNKKHLEYDFVVAPNQNPGAIKLKFQGLTEPLVINSSGDLILETESGTIYQHKPFIYQEITGSKTPVVGSYKIIESNLVGFSLGEYDENQPLIIDPEISYSSYLGGALTDQASAIAIDAQGSVYIVGTTSSTNFPTTSALQRNFGGGPFDVFVAKFNAAGTSLIYATYFGGSSLDQGFDIEVDSTGSAYITGLTLSANFPTQNPLQQSKGGGVFDAFVSKLSPAGNSLIYSTYLGGNDDDQAFSLAINKEGNAFITGSTSSRNFPGTQGMNISGPSDGFVTQLNIQGNQIVYSRFLGGNDEEECAAIVVDSNNNAYITGDTFSTNFPTVRSIQPGLSGVQDAFLTKLKADGSILYSTYFGGNNNESGVDLAVDSDSNVYLLGTTNSTNLLTKLPLQRTLAGGTDSFLVKVDPTGENFMYSTYLGGRADDTATAISLDPLGDVYITGTTFSTDFPVTKPVQDKNKGMNDAFISVIDPAGANFIYSTYLGGKAQDVSLGMVVDKNGTVFLAGSSMSSDFPITNAFQRISGGNSDAFLTRITNELPSPSLPDFALTISPNSQTINPGSSTSFTLNSRAINGFNQPINLSVSTSPSSSALTTSFSSSTIMAGNSPTLTVNAASNINPGAFTITITATSGQITRSLTATVNIVVQDFSISVEPSSQTVVVGSKATFLVRAKGTNGFNKPIILSTSTSPNDSTLVSSFSSETINVDGTSTLTISTTTSTQLLNFTITIVGFSDQTVKTSTATLSVANSAPTPDFSLSINPSQLNVSRKQSGSFNVAVLRSGNFSGNVTVRAPDTKALKIILTPATQSTSGTTLSFNFKIKRKALKGSQMLTFVGLDELGRTRMTTLTLNVQ